MEGAGALVVKVGGREIAPGEGVKAFARWVSDRAREGRRMVIVHGGGEEVSRRAEALGISTQKVAGQRVTTPETLPILAGVLAGEVNLRLVQHLRAAGVTPMGLSGVSAELVRARVAEGGALGLVGEPVRVGSGLLWWMLLNGLTPVLAPLALGPRNEVLNVNADAFAAAIASALGSELLLISDVPGVLDKGGVVLPQLTGLETRSLIAEGTVRDGMVPKVRSALRALDKGARGVWIGSLASASGSLADCTGGTCFSPSDPVSLASSPPSPGTEET